MSIFHPRLSGEVVLFAALGVGVLFLLFIGLQGLWFWRQSKVDLIALEAKIQAKRARNPSYQVRGHSTDEIDALRTHKGAM